MIKSLTNTVTSRVSVPASSSTTPNISPLQRTDCPDSEPTALKGTVKSLLSAEVRQLEQVDSKVPYEAFKLMVPLRGSVLFAVKSTSKFSYSKGATVNDPEEGEELKLPSVLEILQEAVKVCSGWLLTSLKVF